MLRGPWLVRLAIGGMVASTGCGQWAGTPVRTTQAGEVPLGPGPVVSVTRDGYVAGGPLVHANARVVALAWVGAGPQGRAARVAVSRDAGATFDQPLTLGSVPAGDAATGHVDVGVSGAEVPERARIWVRFAPGHGGLAWVSDNGGRSFSAMPIAEVPPSAIPEPWTVEHTAERWFWLRPPRHLQAAGGRRADFPDSVPAGSTPAIVVDDHGALALAWAEENPAGPDVVLRRVWFDWDASAGDVRPFDVPVLVGRATSAEVRPAIARVPGGVVVAWVSDEDGGQSLFARTVGLDMTCTQEQAAGTKSGPTGRR